MGFPFEIITFLGSTVLSGVMSLMAKSSEAKRIQNEMMLKHKEQDQEGWKAAREYQNEKFSFTRRTIALASIFAIIVLPKLVPIFSPETMVVVGYHQWNPGFLFFSGHEEILWRSASGLVITPLDTHMVAAITGMYFGNKVGR